MITKKSKNVHTCTLQREKTTPTSQVSKKKVRPIVLISPDNPLRLRYFKSDLQVRREQTRHVNINPCVIHPFSKFRGRYEIFLVWLYTSVLLTKPMNAFVTPDQALIPFYVEFTIIVDLFCWMDIVVTFFTGFVKHGHNTNVVELNFPNIARHYIFGPYFVCDLLSSFPKGILFYPSIARYTSRYQMVHFLLDLLMVLKFVRVIPLFFYIYRSAQYLQLKSKTGPFLICTLLTTGIIIHWAACVQFGLPRLISYVLPSEARLAKSWIQKTGVYKRSVYAQYCHAFFKSSAYILGIRQNLYGIELSEEYVLALFMYFMGKLLVAVVWLILAMAILNSRSVEVKFLELINQLEEYMTRKMLPLNLRQRLSEYYNYMYQRKYFKEEVINNSLSGVVKKDMTLHICKNVIKNVSLFADLSNEEISTIVSFLVPEIFMPQDVIIQHDSYGDAMYFLATGTVAVYTRSGKEICHLQDGAYFGEVSLLLPEEPRSATITAIETSLLYRLTKKDFEKCVLKNQGVMEKIMRLAEERVRMATQTEEDYKNFLFEQSLKASRFSNSK